MVIVTARYSNFQILYLNKNTSDGGALGAIILPMVGDNCFKDVYEERLIAFG